MMNELRETKSQTFVVPTTMMTTTIILLLSCSITSIWNVHGTIIEDQHGSSTSSSRSSNTSHTNTTATASLSSSSSDDISFPQDQDEETEFVSTGHVSSLFSSLSLTEQRDLRVDYKQAAPWQQDYDMDAEDRRNYEVYQEELKNSLCMSPIQACTYFEIYNTTNRRCFWLNDTIPDICPPTPKCNNDKIECVRLGTYCRNRYLCETIGGGGTPNLEQSCCINCQNLILENCPNWCNSGLPWQTRCDLYRYFGNINRRVNGASDTPNIQAKFQVYKQSLCIPKELGYRCNDAEGARLFCQGYVSDSINNVTGNYPGIREQCLNNCIRVVRNEDYCDCLDIPLPNGRGPMNNGD